MRWISTTIKKKYMDQILSLDKKSEYKPTSEHWNKRIINLLENLTYDRNSPALLLIYNAHEIGINFLCGQKSYKYKVTHIIQHLKPMKIDEVICSTYWEIKLGERINEV